jgi:hypothetical protein
MAPPVGRSPPTKRIEPTQDLCTPEEPFRTLASGTTIIRETPPVEERPACNDHDSTPEAILELTKEVIALLQKQETKGPKTTEIKDTTLKKLDDIVSHLEEHKLLHYQQTNTNTSNETPHGPHPQKNDATTTPTGEQHRLDHQNTLHILNGTAVEIIKAIYGKMESMEKEMVGMRKEMAEMKETLSKNTNNRPWSHTPARVYEQPSPPPPNQARKPHYRKVTPEKNDELKQNGQKLTIKLTMANVDETTKQRLKITSGKLITETFQKAIDKEYHEKTDERPQVCGFEFLSGDTVRLQCYNEKSARMLKETMDWNKVCNGIELRQTKYGVVIHHVDKQHINPGNIDDYPRQIKELEEENKRCNLHIAQISPLRRRQSNETAKHHSIIVFTHDPQEADDCIDKGVIINGRLHRAERYTPQLNIVQCYKCYAFGHTASHCKGQQRCGKCGDTEHETISCSKDTPECHNCHGPHPAWHVHCPKRDEASEKLEQERIRTSRFFTK